MGPYPLLKVVIAGDLDVGKTSLVRQYCEGRFDPARTATTGVDFQTRVVELPDGTVKLSIWDMAGQPQFASVRAGFYPGCLATALVYDLSRPETLKSLAGWYQEIVRVVPRQRFVVVGSKSDLASEPIDTVGLQLARVIRADYLRSSALTGEGITTLFEKLAMLASSAAASQEPTRASAPAA